MKIKLGKTKIRGFWFADKNQGCLFLDEMENYIGKIGVITHLIINDLGEKIRVEFGDYACDYPYYLADDYIVKDDEDFKFDIDVPILKGVYTTSPMHNDVNKRMSESISKLASKINEIITKHKNENKMRNLKITAPEGFEIDKDKSTFEEIVFKPIVKELPKNWDDLKIIEIGYYVTSDSEVQGGGVYSSGEENKNTYATKEQAEASLALAQLSQLLKVYREGEKAIDWTDRHTKYCIEIRCGKAIINVRQETHHFLSFYSEDTCKLFLTNFRDLIEKAKPLMS